MQLMLPRKPYVSWVAIQNPYKRSYNKKRRTEWEINDNYCYERVFQDPYYQSKNLLDLIDLHLFDFITGKAIFILFSNIFTFFSKITLF